MDELAYNLFSRQIRLRFQAKDKLIRLRDLTTDNLLVLLWILRESIVKAERLIKVHQQLYNSNYNSGCGGYLNTWVIIALFFGEEKLFKIEIETVHIFKSPKSMRITHAILLWLYHDSKTHITNRSKTIYWINNK